MGHNHNVAKHTMGPWIAKIRDNALTVPIVSEGGVKLAESCAFTPYWTTAANARLIAAAPDLLAACVSLVEAADNDDYVISEGGQGLNDAIRAAEFAIAKASTPAIATNQEQTRTPGRG
jgi:hypothetical protein